MPPATTTSCGRPESRLLQILALANTDTQQVLASVVRTARQRDLDLPPLIATMLRATGPVVPDAFGLPPPPA